MRGELATAAHYAKAKLRRTAWAVSDKASRNLRGIARAIETERHDTERDGTGRDTIPVGLVTPLAKVRHTEARTSRRRDRARARAQKELIRGELFA